MTGKKLRQTVFCLFVSFVLLPAFLGGAVLNPSTALHKWLRTDEPSSAGVFVRNAGQYLASDMNACSDIAFVYEKGMHSVWFGKGRISHVLTVPATGKIPHGSKVMLEAFRIDMELVGCNMATALGEAETAGPALRFAAGDRNNPCPVSLSRSIRYRDIYPAIDLVFHSSDKGLKYEFVVHPGGDPSRIKLRYKGAERVTLTDRGSLTASSPLGDIVEDAPVAYMMKDDAGTQTGTNVSFALNGDVVSFVVPEYDRTETLVIDPCVHWVTLFGGESTDHGRATVVDAAGNIYLAGITASKRLPIQTGVRTTIAGNMDAFISKFTPDQQLIWSTYFGGKGVEEVTSIALDASGNVFLAGHTTSTDFPVSSGAAQAVLGGRNDAFLVSFSSDGEVRWSTLFGGSFSDEAAGLAVDTQGNVILCGGTYSTNLPTAGIPLQPSNSGDYDAFVAKFTNDGQLKWSTYYGGWSLDFARAVTTDAQNAITVVGHTESSNFPVTGGAYQEKYGGGQYDAFVLHLGPSGERLWATYLGGVDIDQASAVACDGVGNLIVAGLSGSEDFCSQNGVGQTRPAGHVDAFLARFDSKGNKLWSTLHGGARLDEATAVVLLNDGTAAITGSTQSADLPVTPDAMQLKNKGMSDAFIARFSATGGLIWSTYLGGRDWDAGYDMARDPDGNIVMVGSTASSDFPVTSNAMQKKLGGFEDAFLTHIVFNTPVVSAGDDQTICAGTSTVLGATITGGREPRTIRWSPEAGLDSAGSMTPEASPNQTTAYVLTVSDASGCTSSDTVVVSVNPKPRITLARSMALCSGLSAGISATVSGGKEPYTYAWSPTRGLSATDEAAPEASPRSTTMYRLTVTDANGCVAEDSIDVIVHDPPVVDAGDDVEVCLGGRVALKASVTNGEPPYTYAWSPAENMDNPAGAEPTVQPGSTTDFQVVVRDANGCSDTTAVRVTVLQPPVAEAGDDAVACPGSDIALEGKASGGNGPYTYAWAPEEGLSNTSKPRTTATPMRTTRYYLTVKDSKGCTAVDSVTIMVPPSVMVELDESAGTCAGGSVSLHPRVSGGTAPYTYKWKPAKGLDDDEVQSPVASPGVTTSYVLTVTDAKGCMALDTTEIIVHPLPKLRISRPERICPGTSTDLVAAASAGTPPYKFTWTPEEGLSDPTIAAPLASPIRTTTYKVVLTDANGCHVSDSTTISVADPIMVDAGRDTSICADAEVRLRTTASGGEGKLRYAWTPSSGLSSATAPDPSASPSRTTNYTVTVTDASGCTARDSVIVTVYDRPEVNAGANKSICPGTGVRLEAVVTGGLQPYTYSWEPVDGLDDPASVNPMAAPGRTTTYTLRVHDARGCVTTDETTVKVWPALRVSAGEDFELCEGTHARLNGKATGGSGKFTYRWSPAEGLNATDIAKPLASPRTTTIYVLTVRDANGCEASDSVRIMTYKKPHSDAGVGRTICPGTNTTLGSTDRNNGDNFQYSWSPSNGLSDPKARNPIATVEKDTRYVLTVVDEHGCENSDTVLVGVHDVQAPRIALSGANMLCVGDSVVLDAGDGYRSYEWSSGEKSQTIVVHDTAVRSVTVVTQEGCIVQSRPVTIGVYPRPVPVIAVRGPTMLCEGDDAVLEAPRATSWRWSTGETTRTIRVSQSGAYTVSIVDEHGCPGTSESVVITSAPRPSVAIENVSDTLRIKNFDSTYAQMQLKYQWYFNGKQIANAVGPVHTPSNSGSYLLRATNEHGCSEFSNKIRIKLPRRKRD